MKYRKCPRCQLNYISEEMDVCKVCKDEMMGVKSIFDEQEEILLCPYCGKNVMGFDDIMCKSCLAKRNRKTDSP